MIIVAVVHRWQYSMATLYHLVSKLSLMSEVAVDAGLRTHERDFFTKGTEI